MKTSKTLSLILIAGMSSCLLQACGAYNKSPADGLQELKASAQKENDTRNLDQPQVINQPVKIEVPKEVRVEVGVPKVETVTVYKTQSTIDGNSLFISADEGMTFVEGKSSSFNIRVRVMIPGVKVALKSADLPAGAKLEASKTEENLYTLTWAASYNTVAVNNVQKIQKVNFDLDVTATPDDATKNKLAAVKKSKEVSLFVLRDQTPPSELKIDGLKSEILEGTITPITVTVKVPGVDGTAAQKPRLVISYDGISYTQGNSFLETDGTRFLANYNQDPKYIGDFKWQFSMNFDTKNVSVLQQLAKDGSAMVGADGSRVRFSVKAYSPAGSATAEQLSLVKVVYNYNLTAPRFDLSSLGGNSLEVAPGDNLRMVFIVEAGRAQGDVKVEVPNLTGISGNPKITCGASQVGSFRQTCQINWSVPCNAKAADLNQKITLTAQTLIGDKKSDPVKQEIVLTPSKASSNKCVAATAGK